MEKQDSRLQKFLKGLGFVSGSGGVIGLILAATGICLPCVLVPLGLFGAGLMFVFSFMSSYKWWFLGASAISLLLALSAKRVTVCKDGVCEIDPEASKKLVFSFKNLAGNIGKLNNWKTYVALPIVLMFGALLYTFYIAAPKSGSVEMTAAEQAQPDPYAQLFGEAPVKGPADAKVTIIQYSDYFCPHCLPLYEEVIEPTLKKYEGKVRFASVQVNILMNLGYASTHAAYCAEEQGKYWEMHKSLIQQVRPFVGKAKSPELRKEFFAKSKEGTPEFYTKMASTIDKIKPDSFLTCMNSDKYAERIARTTNIFQQLGLQSVPVILVNGQYYNGSRSVQGLSNVIDAMLLAETSQASVSR